MNKECLDCRNQKEQIKSGRNRSETQRFMCRGCRKTSTPEPKGRGYAVEVRDKAFRMYVEVNNFWGIGRLLGVNYQSVVNWVNAYHEKIKNTTVLPAQTPTIEMDEL